MCSILPPLSYIPLQSRPFDYKGLAGQGATTSSDSISSPSPDTSRVFVTRTARGGAVVPSVRVVPVTGGW